MRSLSAASEEASPLKRSRRPDYASAYKQRYKTSLTMHHSVKC